MVSAPFLGTIADILQIFHEQHRAVPAAVCCSQTCNVCSVPGQPDVGAYIVTCATYRPQIFAFQSCPAYSLQYTQVANEKAGTDVVCREKQRRVQHTMIAVIGIPEVPSGSFLVCHRIYVSNKYCNNTLYMHLVAVLHIYHAIKQSR